MSAVWDDAVLMDAYEAAMAKYQMREGLSKRKETLEKGADECMGSHHNNPEEWKKVMTPEPAPSTTFDAEKLSHSESYLKKVDEEHEIRAGSSDESWSSAKVRQQHWQQQLEDLEQQQEQLFKQLYLAGAYILGHRTSANQPRDYVLEGSQHIVGAHQYVTNALFDFGL